MIERLKGAGGQIVGWFFYTAIMDSGLVGIAVWAKPEYAIVLIITGLLAGIAFLAAVVTALALRDERSLTNRFS